MTVRTRDGRDLSETVDFPRGERENPIRDGEVRAKFMALAEPVIGASAAPSVMELVDDLDGLDHVGTLTACLRRRPRRSGGAQKLTEAVTAAYHRGRGPT